MHRIAALFLVLMIAPAFAQVSDDVMRERIEVYRAEARGISGPDRNERFAEAVARVLEGVAFDDLTPRQVSMLYDEGVIGVGGLERRALVRMRRLMETPDDDGARAAILHARLMINERQFSPRATPYLTKAVFAWVDHPRSLQTLEDAEHLLDRLASTDTGFGYVIGVVRETRLAFEELVERALDDASHGSLSAMPVFLDILRKAGTPGDEVDALDAHAVTAIEAALRGHLPSSFRYPLARAINPLPR